MREVKKEVSLNRNSITPDSPAANDAAVPINDTKTPERPLWVEGLESIWSAPEPMNWLVENLLPEKSLVMIAGESGCGKSTLALALAHSVATGTAFLGRQTLRRPVLIVDRENPRYVYHERVKRLHLQQTDGFNVWGLWSSEEPAGPTSEKIEPFAKARHPLIIFDSLVAFHPGSEQDSTETRKYMHQFRKLTALGATVLVIHHTGKGDNTKEYRGSSDIKANVDLSFLLTSRKPRLRYLELASKKVREGDADTLRFSLNESTGSFVCMEDEAHRTVESVIREKPGMSQSDVIAEIRGAVSEHKVRELLKKGVENGVFIETKGMNNANLYNLRAA